MGVAMGGGLADGGMAGMVMAGMPAGGWSFAAAASFLVIWTVMMAAMMLPAAAPMIAIFAAAQARRHRDVAVPTWIFVAGYLLVWAVAGVLVYLLVQIGSDLASRVAAAERARWGPLALGTTLLAAGALSAHAAEARLPPPLPLAFRLRGAALAGRPPGCPPDGPSARGLLPGLLLGAVCRPRRRRGDEPGLDAPAHACGLRREGAATRRAECHRCRRRLPRSRAPGGHRSRSNAVARLSRSHGALDHPPGAGSADRHGRGARSATVSGIRPASPLTPASARCNTHRSHYGRRVPLPAGPDAQKSE